MTSYTLVPATPDLARQLAPNLRHDDAEEVFAATGYGADIVLPIALEFAGQATAAVDDEGVVCMWGVHKATTLSGVGHPWLLGTPRMVTKHRRTFRDLSLLIAENMRLEYDVLENFVDARNKISIRWLGWLGFKVEETPQPYGPFGMPFHKFHWRKN